MNDAVLMGLGEAVDHLDRIPKHVGQGQRAAMKTLSQTLSLQVLHHEEVFVALPSDVVEHADVRMIEPGDNARLSFESLPALSVACQVFRDT